MIGGTLPGAPGMQYGSRDAALRRTRLGAWRLAASIWLVAACASHRTEPTIAPAAAPLPGYVLAWHDEFDGSALDTTRWTIHAGPRRGAVNTPRAVAVSRGVLTITTFTEGDTHYTGFIDTARHYLTRYGWFEARIRFASAPGEWGAFWLQTPTMGQPIGDPGIAGAEIDVVEHRATDTAGTDIRDTYSINLHWDGYGADHKHAGGSGAPPAGAPSLQGGWHTYSLHWTPEGYRFLLDGVEQWATSEGLSHRPEFIRVTCEVEDGAWAGRVPTRGYGSLQRSTTRMQVDWVRVWQAAP